MFAWQNQSKKLRNTFAVILTALMAVGMNAAATVKAFASGVSMTVSSVTHTCGSTSLVVKDLNINGLNENSSYGVVAKVDGFSTEWDYYFSTAAGQTTYNVPSQPFGAADGTSSPDAASSVNLTLYDGSTGPPTAIATAGPYSLPSCTPPNQPPTVNAPDTTIPVNVASVLPLTASDPENDPLTYQWTVPTSAPCWLSSHSVQQPSATCTQPGSYQLPVSVSDGVNPPVNATMKLTVAPPGTPVAADDSTIVTRTLNKTVNVLANDTLPDPNGAVVAITQAPSLGTATVTNNQIVYTAPASVGSTTVGYTVTDEYGQVSNQGILNVLIRYEPNFGIAKLQCAMPHKADGYVVVRVGNLADGAGTETFTVKLGSTSKQVTLDDGSTTTLTFGGLATGSSVTRNYTYYVVQPGGATVHQGFTLHVCSVVHFTAKVGTHVNVKGQTWLVLNNYYSGRSVLIYARDGYGHWHKYRIAALVTKFPYPYVGMPYGRHKISIYRYYGGRKHLVTYRWLTRT